MQTYLRIIIVSNSTIHQRTPNFFFANVLVHSQAPITSSLIVKLVGVDKIETLNVKKIIFFIFFDPFSKFFPYSGKKWIGDRQCSHIKQVRFQQTTHVKILETDFYLQLHLLFYYSLHLAL